ncbi:MAG: T9SS type A sorting domain-containing protein [Cytophagaceae bacterium]
MVLAQAYPVTINWQAPNGGTLASTTTNEFAPGNTFTAAPGTYQVRLNIADSRQCVSDWTTTTVIIGGPGVNTAGWNSGVLSDVNNWNVISNLAVTDNSDVYFVGQDKTTGAASINYYRYDAGFAKWIPTPAFPQPTAGVRSGTNAIAIALGTTLGVYYVDANNNIRRLTATTDVTVFGGFNADLIKLDPAGTLNTAKLVYHNYIDNYIYSWSPLSPTTPSTFYVSYPTKYDIGINNGRVFYVNANESAIYYKDLSENNPSNKGTLLTSLYSINCYTDIVFDASGNVYYATCDGNIYICKKNVSNGYDAPVSIQVPSSRACDGHLTMNMATGTIYYTGYDNRLYQQYVMNLATNQWGNVPATQSYGDVAGRSLVFQAPHLFYVGDNNLVYNLYYFQGCTPSPLRMAGDDSDHITSDNQIYTAGNVQPSSTAGKAFPNPFADQLSVLVEGSGTAVLKITDVNGKVVMKEEYGFDEKQITTSDWVQGMYLCTVEQNGHILYTAKLIKQ